MLISLNWLKKFVDIPKGFSPEDLASKLTMTTVEVEGVQKTGALLDNVVVAKVLAVKNHPNADKLKIATVDTGKDKLEIVCGGVNLKEGMLVALAKIGASVRWHGEAEVTELKPAKIRGVESASMICASEELGIDQIIRCGPEEIADLSELKVEVGMPLAEALKLDDAILEVDHKSMTHRPDLWGHYGLARDLAAILKIKIADYETKPIKAGRKVKLEVEIKDKDKCRRYMGVVVDNVKVGPSPEWLSRQLEAVGVRSINNIVDITNYIMLELGQPMHAFDWREVKGGKIIVETAKKGEKFTTLDGQERKLDEEMLLIKDTKRAVALAGVMGGQNSEIKDDTSTILFESANFKSSNVRQTSMKLGLRSESSARFEKSLDPLLAEMAIKKAVELTLEFCPEAKVASKVVDENFYDFKELEIELDLAWLNRQLGTEIAEEEVIGILERLQFAVKEKKGILTVGVPSWRATKDITLPEDLAEEVARLYGYDNIQPAMPLVSLSVPEINQERQTERRIKNILTGSLAFSESCNYSFVDKSKVGYFGFTPAEHIALKNYLSEEQSLLRTSLIPGLTNNVVDNLRFYDSFQIFEIGRVFLKKPGEDLKGVGSEDKLPWQHKALSGVIVKKGDSEPFYLVKSAIESLLEQLGVAYYFQKPDYALPAWIEKTRVLEVMIKGKPVGSIGELSGRTRASFGLEPAVGYFELDFTELAAMVEDNKKYQELPKYPAVLRDLSILVGAGTKWEDIKKAVKKTGGDLIQNIELFDVYSGGKIEAGKRSLAFHLEFRSPERTLSAEEVENLTKAIVRELESKFGAAVR